METTATTKGQIVILTPITPEFVHSLRGKYKGLGLLKTLVEDKQRERDL